MNPNNSTYFNPKNIFLEPKNDTALGKLSLLAAVKPNTNDQK